MTVRRTTPLCAVIVALGIAGWLGAAGREAAAATQQPAAGGTPWWLHAIGADGLQPPGPGKAVAFVDTGVDMGLPLFAKRPDTEPLNSQRLHTKNQFHGTAVASLVVAPGTESAVHGVYPRARLLLWNAATSGDLTLGDIVKGIDAVSSHGPAVINLSVGGGFYSPEMKAAVLRATARGSLVVAAVGNERPLVTFMARPAGEPHVFTVSSVGPNLAVSTFSQQSSGIDVAAPGESLPVAVPMAFDETGETTLSGTSFSAAIASAAAAWVWTRRPELDNMQLFEVLRHSAHHVGEPGANLDTGFGVIDVAAALKYPAPPRDPQEPNDDVAQVAPGAVVPGGRPFLVSPARRHASITAHLDGTKDPHDVYRVLVPAHSTLVVRTHAPSGMRVRLWNASTVSVDGITDDQPRHLLAGVARDGGPVLLRYANRSGARLIAYVDAWMVQNLAAGYTLDATLQRG